MAKIGLSDGFTLIPEGTHVFLITEVNYKEDFGKMEVTMRTASGQKHIERFSLLKQDGDPNEGGLNAFSYFAKCALNDFTLQEIDEQDLVGHFIRCEVVHTEVESKKNPDKTLTFANLSNKEPADGFDEPVKVQKSATTNTPPSGKKAVPFDLNSILGI